MAIVEAISIFIVAFIIALFLDSTIKALSNLILGPILGYKVSRASFMNFTYVYENEKRTFKISNYTLFPEVQLFVKASSYPRKILLEIVPTLLGFAMTAAIYFYVSNIDVFWNYVAPYLYTILLIAYIYQLCQVINMIINMYGTGTASVIWRDQNRVLELLENGVHPKDISFQYEIPLSETFKTFSTFNYTWFQYYKALESYDYVTLTAMISGITKKISAVFSDWQIPFYYELIYYYSVIIPDLTKVEEYIPDIIDVLSRDKDINGRRVYATYLYYIRKEPQLALNVANEGIAVANSFPLKGLAYMERDILTKLITKIENELSELPS